MKHAREIKMASQQKEQLSEAVQYPVLYTEADMGFKHKNKKQLAWKGVAKEGNLENDKFHSKPKYYLKALGYLLSRNQTTQSYHGKINSFVEFTLFKNNPFLTLAPKIV